MDVSSGSIHIGGVDIAIVSGQKLRSKVVVIPKDTFALPGFVRYNVDPKRRFIGRFHHLSIGKSGAVAQPSGLWWA